MKVVFLGSGNLATRLSLEMKRKGFDIRQVYSHTPVHAEQLANRLQCKWTYLPGKVEIDADFSRQVSPFTPQLVCQPFGMGRCVAVNLPDVEPFALHFEG